MPKLTRLLKHQRTMLTQQYSCPTACLQSEIDFLQELLKGYDASEVEHYTKGVQSWYQVMEKLRAKRAARAQKPKDEAGNESSSAESGGSDSDPDLPDEMVELTAAAISEMNGDELPSAEKRKYTRSDQKGKRAANELVQKWKRENSKDIVSVDPPSSDNVSSKTSSEVLVAPSPSPGNVPDQSKDTNANTDASEKLSRSKLEWVRPFTPNNCQLNRITFAKHVF